MTNATYLTVEEVAALLRIDERTVYRKVEDKTIPGAFRIGPNGPIRFVKEKIMKWIETQAQRNFNK